MTDQPEYATLLYRTDGPVAVITLNRPERMNAWNATMAAELSRALTRANGDDDVRAVVVTGAGRAFCAGADLERGGDTFSNRDRNRPEGTAERPVYPFEIDKPVIAAINGAAIGVGLTYPMLCDQRVVAEDAKLGFVFTRRELGKLDLPARSSGQRQDRHRGTARYAHVGAHLPAAGAGDRPGVPADGAGVGCGYQAPAVGGSRDRFRRHAQT